MPTRPSTVYEEGRKRRLALARQERDRRAKAAAEERAKKVEKAKPKETPKQEAARRERSKPTKPVTKATEARRVAESRAVAKGSKKKETPEQKAKRLGVPFLGKSQPTPAAFFDRVPGVKAAKKELKDMAYGAPDLVADYGTAGVKDIVDTVSLRNARKIAQGKLKDVELPGGHTRKLLKRDAIGMVALYDALVPEPQFLPKALRKEIISGRTATDKTEASIGRGSGKVDETDTPAKAWDFIKKHPVTTAMAVTPFSSTFLRRASVGQLSRSIAKAHPELSAREVARIAAKESKLPGYAAAKGVKGGIPERKLEGEFMSARARALSRTPEGRAGQRAYDRASAAIEKRSGPGAKFSTSQRAATMQARALRKQRSHAGAEITRLEGIEAKGIGRFGRDPAFQDALTTITQAPRGLTPRQAVRVAIRDLVDTARQGHGGDVASAEARKLLGVRIRNLRKSLEGDRLESPEFRSAIAASMKVSDELTASATRMFGEQAGAGLSKRQNLMAERYAKRDLVPRQPSTQRPRTPAEAEARIAELEKITEPAIKKVAAAAFDQFTWRDASGKVIPQSGRTAKGPAREWIPEKPASRANARQQAALERNQAMLEGRGAGGLKGGKQGDFIESSATKGIRRPKSATEKAREYAEQRLYDLGTREGAHPTIARIAAAMDERASLQTALQQTYPEFARPEGASAGSFGTVEVPGMQIPARARGFFPHRSVYERNQGRITAPRMAAAGRVVGVPKKGREFAAGENKLRLYESGKLETSPKVATNTLRSRVSTEQKFASRDLLWENARPIETTEQVLPGAMAIRNPRVAAKKIPPEIKSQLLDPEGPLGADLSPETLQGWLNTWVWRPGHGPMPAWAKDVKNVRVVPEGVAKTVLTDVFASAPRGSLASILGTLNSLARAVTIYTPYAGARYVARNAPQNIILEGLTHPGSFRNLPAATWGLRRSDPQLYSQIKVEVGDIPASAGLPDLPSPLQTRAQRLEAGTVQGSRKIAGKLGEVADEPFRVSSWIGYAKAYDYKTPADWRRLMHSDNPAEIRVREDIAQRVREDMIDFDALTPFERETLSRYIFIYPFIRGAAKWPAMYFREYPVRSAVMALLAKQHTREETEGRRTSVLESGRTEIAGKEVDLGWMFPQQPAAGTAEDLIKTAQALRTSPREAAKQASGMLSPQYREIVGTDYGGWDRSKRAFVPGYSTVERLAEGGGLGEQALRFFGSDIRYIEPVKLKPKQKAHTRVEKEREEMRATLEAVRPQDVADGKLPPALRKAFAQREQVEIIRAEAKDAYDKETWPLHAFSNELDLLVRWKVIPPSEAKQGKGWARKPGRTRDEIMEARTWIGDHYFDDAYLGLLRDTRKWAEEEATK